MTKLYSIRTLGCKVNQYESEAMARMLNQAGWLRAEEGCDLVLINTCTVTARTDKECRQVIRRAARENPAAQVIVTGCLAQVEPDDLAAMAEVDLILPQADQDLLMAVLDANLDLSKVRSSGRTGFTDLALPIRQPRSRAFFKIQDGCNKACTYCRIRLARGRSRSMAFDRAVDSAARLAQAGYRELVLTGVHLGAYGRDLSPARSLTDLIAALLADGLDYRLRLSSLEPREVDDALLRLAEHPRFCDHFHLPLQSGSPAVLKAMARGYTPAEYRAAVEAVANKLPQAAIGADVIVGFPGETEADFQETVNLVDQTPIAYLHVFPFSRRPGVKADELPDQVDQAIVKARAARLRAVAQTKRNRFYNQALGQRFKMLIESRRDRKTKLLTGRSGNYLPLVLDGDDALFGRLVEVEAIKRLGAKILVKPA